ncbi:hypothetical protein CcaverHIS002_0108340 [Cutaneotrichosporon cavernicola]|uniref:FAD dependent oxidoreductase domain-containing protein n=1 Tax=Cutaneotrichosporon cavernicola TaxID=279322 RepID=A0AA48I204_9TREE|nr:uncharacterized protein CcaverHIS019_0108270 [Cutaneotrichosporon cavernicola]BEI80305.1 hypothetical protein CcaverHIS002_0108340 [Cutaneotrichosporon cavernicola]BEI88109.1 hypothetical protein CcaverHIS019_0108270 [Cutaneotrichosporon cavernicola]BEI95880.1 hypothetical protein CcaverHIS631_0108290 [Cutaneotrichosporon cavernicola]BEJ03654.1 hypothetical protein CcaverHIS641_0108290 [Cutaneotrichosporon cavernicola]
MSNRFAKPSVLIVGSGEFGSTTAVELLRSGNYSSVTVLDRLQTIPAVDAASTDINKVVRFDYADEEYAVLAHEAIQRWLRPEWKGIYFNTGCLVRGLTDPQSQRIYQNSLALEPRTRLLHDPEEIRKVLSPSGKAVVGEKSLIKSFHNPQGGWVHASGAINKLYRDIDWLGGKIVTGADVTELIKSDDGSDVVGVRCRDGREFRADKIIMAMGSWTGAHPALRGVFPDNLLVPTGQTVAAVQLTPEEHARYADMPTIANLEGSGYYQFPPNQTGLVKFALHAGGYVLPSNIPRTAADPKAVEFSEKNRVGWIPRQSFKNMRDKFAELWPELAKKPMAYTRMCWYSDTPDGNWVIDFAPQYPSLLIASGGAGHAFKFLPVMGELIRGRLEGHLPTNLVKKWAINREVPLVDLDRDGRPGRQPLVLGDLTTLEELGPLAPNAEKRESRL